MIKKIDLRLALQLAADPQQVRAAAAASVGWREADIQVEVLRRSIDARQRQAFVQLQVNVYKDEVPPAATDYLAQLHDVSDAPEILIVGAGPAGYFAALQLIQEGFRPVIIERGKDVQARRRDLKAIQQDGTVNPHSNYCYGEGGAGTYSDGKLYTRSVKRGDWWKVLCLLVEHGANPDILVEAHPHIGSNKLPKIVAEIRQTIEKHGGKVIFDSFVTDFIINNDAIAGVIVNENTEYRAEAVILATGHSARDIYYLCQRKKVAMEAKPFALGVRIEHQQSLIDTAQYRQSPRHELLPAAPYKLVTQVRERGVFSFCMCPGGLVVPAATAPGEIVVNGMSMSRRDSEFANSGTVTAIEISDFEPYKKHGVLAGLAFQQAVEQAMFAVSDGTQRAPAQRLTDFVQGKISSSLPKTSYIPGLISAPLHEILPTFVSERLREGVKKFGQQMNGYFTENANVIGTESRTSAPVRIPRNPDTLMHVHIQNLFPCGEGAGYAGGILSAAMDGQNVATAIAKIYTKK